MNHKNNQSTYVQLWLQRAVHGNVKNSVLELMMNIQGSIWSFSVGF